MIYIYIREYLSPSNRAKYEVRFNSTIKLSWIRVYNGSQIYRTISIIRNTNSKFYLFEILKISRAIKVKPLSNKPTLIALTQIRVTSLIILRNYSVLSSNININIVRIKISCIHTFIISETHIIKRIYNYLWCITIKSKPNLIIINDRRKTMNIFCNNIQRCFCYIYICIKRSCHKILSVSSRSIKSIERAVVTKIDIIVIYKSTTVSTGKSSMSIDFRKSVCISITVNTFTINDPYILVSTNNKSGIKLKEIYYTVTCWFENKCMRRRKIIRISLLWHKQNIITFRISAHTKLTIVYGNISWFVRKEVFTSLFIIKFVHTRFVPNIFVSNNHIASGIRNIIRYISSKTSSTIRLFNNSFKVFVKTASRSNYLGSSLSSIIGSPSNIINSILNIWFKLFPNNDLITSFISLCGLIC